MVLSPSLPTSSEIFCFPSELDTITVSEITLTAVSVKVMLGQQTLIDTTLTPFGGGTYGEVRLTDMARLITDRLIPDSSAETRDTLRLRVYVESSLMGECIILPLRMRMGSESAASTISHEFLTPASAGTKIVPPTAVETLTWIIPDNYDPSGPAQDQLRLSALWYNPQTRAAATTTPDPIQASATGANSLYIKATIPLATIPTPGADWKLVSLTATAAARTITYRIAPQWLTLCSEVTPIRFLNAYGAHDTFYFYGVRSEETKPTYTAATIEGLTRNYQIDVQPEWKAQTGPLGKTELALLHHLVQARRLWLLTDGEELTLTSCELKPTNELHTAQTASISFREAREGQRLSSSLRVRTFDGTFDEKFL